MARQSFAAGQDMPYSEVLLFGAGGLGIETADHFALVPRSPNTCGGEALVACSWPTTLQTECRTQSIPDYQARVRLSPRWPRLRPLSIPSWSSARSTSSRWWRSMSTRPRNNSSSIYTRRLRARYPRPRPGWEPGRWPTSSRSNAPSTGKSARAAGGNVEVPELKPAPPASQQSLGLSHTRAPE